MSGTVKYVRTDNPQLFDELGTPAYFRFRQNSLTIRVDARDMLPDPDVPQNLDLVSQTIIEPYKQHREARQQGAFLCLISRVRVLPGGRLLAYEVIDDVAYVDVHRRSMSEDLVQALTALGNNFGRHLTR